MVVFTPEQLTAFFTDNAQMGLQEETLEQISEEGIAAPEDLCDFNDKSFKELVANLQKPGGTMDNPVYLAAEEQLERIPAKNKEEKRRAEDRLASIPEEITRRGFVLGVKV